ncbi:MAG: hypothetical protein QMD46_05170 [Methanomicrobiales archaeon]|nr:hypothetical protein [Methanomicrobiales archaeon]MDI6875533.1 hypothetical protein [Methanomicrobiales archaeon]
MPEKLCPIDKQPCMGGRCAIYNEELRLCSWAALGGVRASRDEDRTAEYEAAKKARDERSKRYRVHLFD